MASNGITNGTQDTCSAWKLGLRNQETGGYLTAESFGGELNAKGPSLRKKQVWEIDFHPKSDDLICLKSHRGRYISADKNDDVHCEIGPEDKLSKVHEKGTCGFKLEYGGKGCWALKNEKFETYLGVDGDKLTCKSKKPVLWMPHLAIHPQVNIMNVQRKRCACLVKVDEKDPSRDELRCSEVIPWGEKCLITIEFCDGWYALKTFDGRYLESTSKLVEERNEKTLFTLEMRQNVPDQGIAFKDANGKYLTAVGSGAMKSKNSSISKDELFTLIDSQPQVYLVSYKDKKASTKQGVHVSANQAEVSDKETFQMELEKPDKTANALTKRWRFRCVDGKYWKLGEGGGIQAVASSADDAAVFEIEWCEDGKVTLKASNDSYVTAIKNGHLYATSATVSHNEKFAVVLLNRPLLVLKGEYGLVGYKSKGNYKLECNKSVYDIIHVEHQDNGIYYLKGDNGKYWNIASDCSISADGESPEPFKFEFHALSKFAIRCQNGNLIKGEQNGTFVAKGTDIGSSTLWEY